MTDIAQDSKFRLKPIPLLVTAALGYAIPYGAAYAAAFAAKFVPAVDWRHSMLGWLYVHHGFQMLLGLGVIAVLKYWLVPADYGLHAPRGKSYIVAALAWGVAFGILMTVVDYFPQLVAASKPDPGFPLTTANVLGWTFFEGIYVGPTEEIPFRALLVTYLAATMPGKLHIGRFHMNWAGIFVAVIFALLHAQNFSTHNWPEALGQQIYAFALGVLYAYWLEKSKSVVAPIIGHNVGDVTEYLILFAWAGLT